jgi:hypothetical protein
MAGLGCGHPFSPLALRARMCHFPTMVELLKTNDLVLISYILHRLGEAGIEALVFDEHMSAVEGSIGALPRRIMVGEEDLERSRNLLGNDVLTYPR